MDITSPIRIAIISDSRKASHFARMTAERWTPDLRVQITLLGNPWQFEFLSNGPVPTEDKGLLSGVDVIIISAHREAVLPAYVKAWLHEMPETGICPSALVALMDQEQDSLPRLLTLRSYLRETTENRRRPFLHPEDREEPFEPEDNSRRLVRQPYSPMDD
jgi:hypothetical protein